jgi:NADH-quinone oxidoreductase subunit G
MIDVCPVGALTDKTFRFKNRVWFTRPLDAHRDCPTCCGKVTLWNRGDEVLRVTARKDEWGEVQSYDGKPGWICNTCRFDKKDMGDWVVEHPTNISRHSVISANHYVDTKKPKEILPDVMGGRKAKLLMDIHDVSDVNKPEIDLSKIPGPATSLTFTTKEQQQ